MRVHLILAATLLSGCLVTETSLFEFQGTDTNFSQNALNGRSFSGQSVSSRFGEFETANVSVVVDDAFSATVTIDGEAHRLRKFSGDTYENLLGTETLIVETQLAGGPVTPDVLYFVITDRPPPSVVGPRTSFLVDGNFTSASALPNTNTRFTGVTSMFEDDSRTANGTITLDVDFLNNDFDAIIAGSDPSDASAVYTVTGGSEFSGDLIGTVDGPNVLNGALNGKIYGSGADQAAGTLFIIRNDRSLIGTFGAID